MIPDRLLSACIVALYAWAMGSMVWTGDVYRVVGVADVPFVAAAAIAAALVSVTGFASVWSAPGGVPPRSHAGDGHVHAADAQADADGDGGESRRSPVWVSACLYALVALPPCTYLIDWYLRMS